MSNTQHMIGLIASGVSVAALIIILMGFHILPIVVVVATLLPLSPPGAGVTWRDRASCVTLWPGTMVVITGCRHELRVILISGVKSCSDQSDGTKVRC